MKYEIYRDDIKKIVLKEVEAQDCEEAVSKYVSALMVAGIVAMGKDVAKSVSENVFRITRADGRFFNVECRNI